MKFSTTLAVLLTGLATASPLMVRDPQSLLIPDEVSNPAQVNDMMLPDEVSNPAQVNDMMLPEGVSHPAQVNDMMLPEGVSPPAQVNDMMLPDEELDRARAKELIENATFEPADVFPPSVVTTGPKNSKGLTKENCDDVLKNHGAELAAEAGCLEFN